MKIGVVIVGHGSRVPKSMRVYEEIARKAAEKSDFEVEVSYMKHGRPSVPEAINNFIKKGMKKIVIVPLFLLPGLHVLNDIPKLLYEVKIPENIQIIYANHIGADERLAEVVVDRVKEALK